MRRLWGAALIALAMAALIAACGGEPEAPTAPATLPAPELITIATGEAGVIILEWAGGPESATGWQYRQRLTKRGTWGAWTDVPSSTGTTKSYRITGLETYRAYYFQVRAVTDAGSSRASDAVRGPTLDYEQGIPNLPEGQLVEGGDRRWLLGGIIEVTIPAGVRMKFGGAFTDAGMFASLYHPETGSGISFNVETGESRRAVESLEGATVDMDAVFDQIVDSMTRRGITLREKRRAGAPTYTRPPARESGVQELITVSDGSLDALLLEWTSGPEDAIGWQYRQRETYDPAWGPWRDVPDSGDGTRSYRVTGLESHLTYHFQVRAVTDAGPRAASLSAKGQTPAFNHNLTDLGEWQLVEGGGRRWLLAGNIEITIPDGARVSACRGEYTSNGLSIISLCHPASGSFLTFDVETGELLGEWLESPEGVDANGSAVDVAALFNQILFSLTLRTPPATPVPTPTPELSDTLTLIAVTDSSPDSLLLEWTGGPTDARRWQYRVRGALGETWGPWRDVPGSTGTTRSYRIPGLWQFYGYYFQVRPVTAAGSGAASPESLGATTRWSEGMLKIFPELIYEGGGHRWLLDSTLELTIPAGVRVVQCGGAATPASYVLVSLCHPESGSTLTFNAETGELLNERIRSLEGADVSGSATVVELFKQIPGTVRFRPGISPIEPPPVTPKLITVADASPDSLLLEWTDGPADAVSWQYRQRADRDGAWGMWLRMWNSTGSTGSYRVTGLGRHYPYFFQVRPVTDRGPGLASPERLGATPYRVDGVLALVPGQVVESGGHRWLLRRTIELTIPAGVRVMDCGGGFSEDYVVVSLCLPGSSSYLAFNVETGELVDKWIRSPGDAEASGSEMDVGALFDQILSTMRFRP